jgi:hypothetical protein
MKKLLALLLALAVSLPINAHALVGKGAIISCNAIEDPAGGNFNRLTDRTANIARACREVGLNVDLIAAGDTGAYGAVGVPDSAWFRQHYDFIIVPSQGAISSTASHFSNKIYLGFRNDGRGGAIMTAPESLNSPYTGRWDIPTFVWSFDAVNNNTAKFANGALSIIGGTLDISSKMQMTTASCPTSDGTKGDTIFVDSRRTVRDISDGRVKALLSGVNGKTNKPSASADTMSYFLWRPDPAKAGCYWFTIRENNPLGNNPPIIWSVAEAIIIGQVCQVVGIRPRAPLVAWYDIDHIHPQSSTSGGTGRTQAYNARDMAAFGDSLRAWGWKISAPTQCGASIGDATLTSDNSGQGFVQDSVKIVVKNYSDVFAFHVHDHFNANTSNWRSQSSDTASVCRINYNAVVASGAQSRWKNLFVPAAGSFGFYQTLPQDDGDFRATKVFGDAGVREIRAPGGTFIDITNVQQMNARAILVRSGQMTIPEYGLPQPYRSIGPNPQIVWACGEASAVGATVRSMATYIGGGDYQTSSAGWMGLCFPAWMARGSAYFHGNENFQGLTASPEYQAWPIQLVKHSKNMLKLTYPFMLPMTADNMKYKARSEISGQ